MKKNQESKHEKSPKIYQVFGFACKIVDDFCVFSECVFFHNKINNPFGGLTFFQGKVTIIIGREIKHTFYTRKSINFFFWLRSALLTRIVLLNNEPFDNSNNNPIWGGSEVTVEELPHHSGELSHALSVIGGPTQSQLSRLCRHDTTSPWSTDYGGNICS